MRILLIHRYFWPDTPPYASMLRVYGNSWTGSGHHVDVFTSQPSYKRELHNEKRESFETVDGIGIHRCALIKESRGGAVLRLLNIALFLIQMSWFLVARSRYDVIVMSTVPQVFGAWLASLIATVKNTRFIYHMQDIHPEGAEVTGVLKNRLLIRLLRRLDTQTCNRAYQIVVLSGDMKNTLVTRSSALSGKIRVIKNPVVQEFSNKTCEPEGLLKSANMFRVVFAGNIGRWQALDKVVEAGILLKDKPGIEIVLLGDGVCKAALIQQANKGNANNVRFFGHQPVSVADEIVQDADLSLITLAPGMYKVAFPSKIMTYCSAGVPVLAMIETHSDLAKLINEQNIGYCVDMNDVRALAAVILEASQEPGIVTRLGANAKKFSEQAFDEEQILSVWNEMIGSQHA